MMMRSHLRIWLPAAILATSGAFSEVRGQAYCALRDPIGTIQQLAPDASGRRSIVEVVGAEARKSVSEKLPFTLHFNELGKHTLYVVLKDGLPDGLVHARSEKGRWGLVEIVWYFDLDLRIRGFRFQRCRDSNRGELESDAFVGQLRGKQFPELRRLLTEDGGDLTGGGLRVSADAAPLAVTCLRSALKTIVVTEEVWAKHIPVLRESAKVGARQDSPQIPEPSAPPGRALAPVKDLYNKGVMQLLGALHQEKEWIINRSTTRAERIINPQGEASGMMVTTQCTAVETIVSISWLIGPDGRIRSVTILDKWPADDIQEAFSGMEGLSLGALKECSTAGELAAAEVLAISQIHLGV